MHQFAFKTINIYSNVAKKKLYSKHGVALVSKIDNS